MSILGSKVQETTTMSNEFISVEFECDIWPDYIYTYIHVER